MATPTLGSSQRNLPPVGEKKPKARAVLAHKLAVLQDELDADRAAKAKLLGKTAALKARMDNLRTFEAGLAKTKKDHDAFNCQRAEMVANRTQALGANGMLTFTERFGEGNHVKPSQPGRNSRRTRFYRDYTGKCELGECEWVDNWNLRQRANSQMEERAVVQASIPRVAREKPIRESIALPDLEQYKGRSTLRTRHYYDYEGKRINMDPCDWPQHNGFVLIGY
jgi:hypothetical protein